MTFDEEDVRFVLRLAWAKGNIIASCLPGESVEHDAQRDAEVERCIEILKGVEVGKVECSAEQAFVEIWLRKLASPEVPS